VLTPLALELFRSVQYQVMLGSVLMALE